MNKVNVIIKKIDKEYIDKEYDKILSKLYPQRIEAVKRLNNRQAFYASITAGILLVNAFDRVYGSGGKKISIIREEKGKPFISGKDEFKFNLSHSGDYAVIAYTVDSDISTVGIDIERIRQRDDDMKVANRFFTRQEIDYLSNGLECSDIDMRFYEIWTMKEAFIKLTGKGLGQRLDSFCVYPEEKSLTILDEEILHLLPGLKGYGSDIHYDLMKNDGHIISVCAGCASDVMFEYEKATD